MGASCRATASETATYQEGVVKFGMELHCKNAVFIALSSELQLHSCVLSKCKEICIIHM